MPNATRLSPAQWRTLMELYLHQMWSSNVRASVRSIQRAQGIGQDELGQLVESSLIGSSPSEGPGDPARLRLTQQGLRFVLNDEWSQVLFTLGNAGRRLTPAELFEDNEISWATLVRLQKDDLVSASSLDDGHVVDLEKADSPSRRDVRLCLTSKGAEYLPR